MPATFNDAIFDAGLNYVRTNTSSLFICSAQPTTYTQAITTYALGSKATPTISAPADHTSGRKVTVSAITDGTVSANGTAAFYALVDAANSALLVAQALSPTQVVTSGNVFTLDAIIVALPDPTA